MNTHQSTKIEMSKSEFADLGGGHIAYIRRIGPGRASVLLGRPVSAPNGGQLFCLYNADGSPVSLSDSRASAMASAVQHDLTPMSVH